MIGKAKSVSHARECLSYALSKGMAVEVCRENLAGETPGELADEFAVVQSRNNRCRNNTLRIEISPTIEDGNKLTNEQWEGIARDFVEQMELAENRQYIAILHQDTHHKHLHIIANRIDFNGVAYSDSNISLRAGKVCEQIAIERGLRTAMNVRHENEQKLEPLKQKIRQLHGEIMRSGMSEKEYAQQMAKRGVEVVYNQSKTTGRISGMSYVVDGQRIKASQVGREFGYNKLFRAVDVASVRHKNVAVRHHGSHTSVVTMSAIARMTAKSHEGHDSRSKDVEKEEYELTI